MLFRHNHKLPDLALQKPVFVDGRDIQHINNITPVPEQNEVFDWQDIENLAPVVGSIGLNREVALEYLESNPGCEANLLQEL